MRFILSAAACFSVCLFLSANNANAHGPGGGSHAGDHSGGHPNAPVHAGNANGFMPGTPAANRPNVSSLNPNSSTGTTSTSGSSSAINTSGATSGATNTNSLTGGSSPLAGELAQIHHLEQELRRLKMEEALQLLQRAKQSNNPQLLAKAEEMLQHKQQNRSLQGGNGNATAAAGQSTAHPTPAAGGHSGNQTHLSHTSPGGHSSGHAHR
ncbi:MAG TPA: hypothetical protein VGI40_04255 [Pirellulaceae bacterium]|jgi:hypothetical protein